MSVINVKRESYKAMNSIKGMLLVLCLGASCANAAVITQTQNIGEHVPSKSGDLTFGYFDESLGTLLSVQIVTSVTWWGGYYALDNDSDVASSGEGRWGMTIKLSDVPGVLSSATTKSDYVSDTFSLAKNDGDPTSQFDVGGLDYDRLEGPTYETRRTIGVTVDVAENKLNDYFSNVAGNFVIGYNTTQDQSFSGVSGNSMSSSPLSASGYVTITYNYTPVPEPATASLACAGLLMLLRRRRQA